MPETAIAGINRFPWLLLRGLLRRVLRPVFFVRGFRIVGAARLPRSMSPMIVIANHAALTDSLYFILAISPRFIVCGARSRLFRNAGLRALMATGNILRVESREQFLRDCGDLLNHGEILLVYPEMGRFPDGMGEFKTWAAELALSTGAPLLPCYLYGTTRGHTGRPRLYVGEPIEPRGEAAELTGILYRAVQDLAPGRERSLETPA